MTYTHHLIHLSHRKRLLPAQTITIITACSDSTPGYRQCLFAHLPGPPPCIIFLLIFLVEYSDFRRSKTEGLIAIIMDYDHMIIAIIILWQCLWRRWSWNNFSTGDNACNENHFVTVENCEKKYFSTGESLTKTNFPFEGMVGYYSTFDQVNMPSTPHFDIILHDQSSSTEDKRILNSKSKHLKGNVLVSLSQPFLIKNGKKEIRPHSGPTCTEGLNIHKSPKNS